MPVPVPTRAAAGAGAASTPSSSGARIVLAPGAARPLAFRFRPEGALGRVQLVTRPPAAPAVLAGAPAVARDALLHASFMTVEIRDGAPGSFPRALFAIADPDAEPDRIDADVLARFPGAARVSVDEADAQFLACCLRMPVIFVVPGDEATGAYDAVYRDRQRHCLACPPSR